MTDPRWLDGSRDPVAAELRRALDEAKQRASDDVALRRIWGKVAYVEPEVRHPRWFWFAGGVACSAMLTMLVVMLWPRSTGID
ncbi:MAG TPA: hypothetical protein VFH73_22215, partial [Polyangia bacterium]|nr:hypothetical protein [Polyangia bacterium]